MNAIKKLLPLALFCLSVFVACNKDDIMTLRGQAMVTFAGTILDDNGNAVLGAQVWSGNESAITDKNGVFKLKPVLADPHNAILHVEKAGYFATSRAWHVQPNTTQHVTVRLLRKTEVGTISGANGGQVAVAGGATINFPGGAIAQKSGAQHNAQVVVYARYLDPTSPTLGLEMPGDLRAINTNQEQGVLATFGMIGVELESTTGAPLQIAAGSEVEIRLPIPAEKAAVAPQTIPLWHYDLESARWIEEGSAQKIGNEYVGKVRHFSFWNCDAFLETVYMEGSVYLQNRQTPFDFCQIKLTVVSTGFVGYGYASALGWFGGDIPKGEAILLEVTTWNGCGTQVLYSETVGPFTENTVLPDIILMNGLDKSTVSGRLVDCNNNPVENGYVKISSDFFAQAVLTDIDGTYSYSFFNCNNTITELVVQGYDLDNYLESSIASVPVTSSSVSVPDIQVCNSLSEFITYNYDGQDVTLINVSSFTFALDSILNNSFLTAIQSSDSTANNLNFQFINDLQTGTFDLTSLFFNSQELFFPANGNMTTTVTQVATNPGNVITGTFGTTFTDLNGVSHTLSGSYRVIRDW
jgi:hypothetical protein